MWIQKELTLKPRSRGFHLVTTELLASLPEIETIRHGLLNLFIKHTSASLTINENADPSVSGDILTALNTMVPLHGRYQHGEGNSPAHIKASLTGFSQAVFVESGKLVLGTWQGIFLCEFDGPRHRKVCVKVLRG